MQSVVKDSVSNSKQEEKDEKEPLLVRFLPYIFKQSDTTKAYISLFSDPDGNLEKYIQYLKLSKNEKMSLLHIWLEIDEDGNNKMSYDEFIEYFNIEKDIWSKRTFQIMNISYTGVVSFVELLKFCSKYLIVDKKNMIEFCFRLLSRRGQTFLPKSSVLILDDFKDYIDFHYKNSTSAQLKKRSMNVFKYIDIDGDGGLDIGEFYHFCDERNASFLKFTHSIQQHLRKVVFGIQFWVEKTRLIKMSEAKGFSSLTTLSRINHKDEMFTVEKLYNPVIDRDGYPIPIIPYDPKPGDEGKESKKKNVAWRGYFNASKYKKGHFEDEFTEVAIMEKRKKLEREKKRQMHLKNINKLTSKAHDRMTEALNDLITGRKAIKLAFLQWLYVCDLQSKPAAMAIGVGSNNSNDTVDSKVEEDAVEETSPVAVDVHKQILDMAINVEEEAYNNASSNYIYKYEKLINENAHVIRPDRTRDLSHNIFMIRKLYSENGALSS